MEENKKEEIRELLKKSATTDHFNKQKHEDNTKQKSSNEAMLKNNSSNNTILISLVITLLILLASAFFIYNQNKQINKLKETINSIKKIEQPKTVVKEKIVIEEKEIIKEVKVADQNLTKEKFKEFYNTRDFNKLNCYDYNIGGIKASISCINKLKKFLIDNKNALRIEIIPVVSIKDKELFNGLDKIDLKNYSTENRLIKYALRGLSRHRVLDLSWKIKQLSDNTILTPTNYFVESKSGNSGVIIKAYY